jgi:EVE domain
MAILMAIACAFFFGHAMSKNWIAVASAEHVRLGRSNGFMQVSHGKSAPLRRIEPGDRVVFYSPTDAFRGKDELQSFTAIGVVKEGAPYQVDMGDGFSPFRRDVTWQTAAETRSGRFSSSWSSRKATGTGGINSAPAWRDQ